jgi:hypothetical protein
LAEADVREVAALAGREVEDLAARSRVAPERLASWIQVADLQREAGVPLDAAVSLVEAGVAGPQGLRELAAEEIAARLQWSGGGGIPLGDIRRWKLRVQAPPSS